MNCFTVLMYTFNVHVAIVLQLKEIRYVAGIYTKTWLWQYYKIAEHIIYVILIHGHHLITDLTS
jgi:hypothetical protein